MIIPNPVLLVLVLREPCSVGIEPRVPVCNVSVQLPEKSLSPVPNFQSIDLSQAGRKGKELANRVRAKEADQLPLG